MDTETLRADINAALVRAERLDAKIREALALCDDMDAGVRYLLTLCLDGEQAAQCYAGILTGVLDDDEESGAEDCVSDWDECPF